MIDRAQIEAKRAMLQAQRDTQGRQLVELQQALAATQRSIAQLDGALLVLQELMTETAEGEA